MSIKILDIQLPREKEHLQKCIDAFNELCDKGLYPDVLDYSPFELYNATRGKISISTWKEFLLDPVITNWYSTERTLMLRQQVNKLIKEAGTSKSTASAQTLTTLLKQLNETESQNTGDTKFVYTFVPITQQERKNPIINVDENIPNSIRDAIQIIQRNPNKRN